MPGQGARGRPFMIKEGKEMVSSVVPREASGARGEAESKEEGLVSEPTEHWSWEAQGRTPLTEGSVPHRGPSGLPMKSSHRGAGVPVLCRGPLQWRAAGLAIRTPLPAARSSPPPPPLKNGGPPPPGQHHVRMQRCYRGPSQPSPVLSTAQ